MPSIDIGLNMALVAGAAMGAVVYLLTRVAIGKRANAMVGGSVIAAFVLQPWWASAAAYLLGHIAAAYLVSVVVKEKTTRQTNLLLLMLACVVFVFGDLRAMSEVSGVIRAAESEKLRAFEVGTVADQFIAAHYVPCINHRTSYMQVAIRGVRFQDAPSESAVSCKAATLAYADKTKGEPFTRLVAASMQKWDERAVLDDESKARLDKLIKTTWG